MPKLFLSLFIGLRFSRSRYRSGMVSLISVLSTSGIALGVSILIVGLSAVNGFERELNNRILAVVPHGEIEPIVQPWKNWSDALRKIKRVPGIVAAAPYITFSHLAISGTSLLPIKVKGVDPNQELQISALPRFLQNNTWKHFRAGECQIIIGQGVAEALKVKQGDWVSIMIPIGNDHHILRHPRRVRLHVTGIFQLHGQVDHNLALIPIEDAREYLNIGGGVTGIAIRVNAPFKANKLVRDAGAASDNYVYVKSWISNYGYMHRDIQMIRAVMYLAISCLVGVASFNIVSILVMEVKDKSSDIAVLCTMGAKRALIRTIFIWYGLLMGVFGSMCGMTIGVFLSLYLTPISNSIEKLIGYRFLSGNVYFIDFLPSELHWQDIIYVVTATLFLSLVASWFPASRASRIDPITALSRQ